MNDQNSLLIYTLNEFYIFDNNNNNIRIIINTGLNKNT